MLCGELKPLDDGRRSHPVPDAHRLQAVTAAGPTKLMHELGYGADYQYAHDHAEAYTPQEYLPEALRGVKWYQPTEFGYEKTVKERIDWWQRIKREAGDGMEGA